jgi:hypothetical protein
MGVYVQTLEDSARKRQGRGFRSLMQSDTVSRTRLPRFDRCFGSALSRVGKHLFSVFPRQRRLCDHAGQIWGLGLDPHSKLPHIGLHILRCQLGHKPIFP